VMGTWLDLAGEYHDIDHSQALLLFLNIYKYIIRDNYLLSPLFSGCLAKRTMFEGCCQS
jgi:hypothetical protein